MRRPVLLLVAVAMTAVLLARGAAPVAHACSVGPDFDLVRDSEIIVAGRFTGWNIPQDVDLPVWFPDYGPDSPAQPAPVAAHLAVESVYKGEAPAKLSVLSYSSLEVWDHEPKYVWTGANGACGAFAGDPTNVYAIIALSEGDDGYYGSFIFGWFFRGPEPNGDRYEKAVSHLESRGLTAKPARGSIDFPGNEAPLVPIVAAGVAIPIGFLLGATFAGRGRSRP